MKLAFLLPLAAVLSLSTAPLLAMSSSGEESPRGNDRFSASEWNAIVSIRNCASAYYNAKTNPEKALIARAFDTVFVSSSSVQKAYKAKNRATFTGHSATFYAAVREMGAGGCIPA